jgi:hypothetical protein
MVISAVIRINVNQQIDTLLSYVTANDYKVFGMLVGISLFDILINALPMMCRFLTLTHTLADAETAIEAI